MDEIILKIDDQQGPLDWGEAGAWLMDQVPLGSGPFDNQIAEGTVGGGSKARLDDDGAVRLFQNGGAS